MKLYMWWIYHDSSILQLYIIIFILKLRGNKNNGDEIMTGNNKTNSLKILKNLVVDVKSPERKIPTYGRMIDVNDQFITLERSDGSITTVSTKFIEAIWPTRNQPIADPRGGAHEA